MKSSADSLALTSIDQFYFFIFRSDNNKITVENYGETVQERLIPNPVRTFGEAYADYRKFLSFVKVNPRNTHGNPHSCRVPASIDPFHFRVLHFLHDEHVFFGRETAYMYMHTLPLPDENLVVFVDLA